MDVFQYNLFITALPPPVPPKVTPMFEPLVGLLQCDIMVHIMHLILQRTVAVRSRSWSEAQVDRVSILYEGQHRLLYKS